MDTTSRLAAHFDDAEEFVGELRQDRDQVKRQIVRVTVVMVSRPSLVLQQLWVEAGAIVAGRLVHFRRYCRDLMNMPEYGERVSARTESQRGSSSASSATRTSSRSAGG